MNRFFPWLYERNILLMLLLVLCIFGAIVYWVVFGLMVSNFHNAVRVERSNPGTNITIVNQISGCSQH